VPIAGYWNKIAPQAAPATHPHGRPAYETPRVDPNADNGDIITPVNVVTRGAGPSAHHR
jgi:hypothetical protein